MFYKSIRLYHLPTSSELDDSTAQCYGSCPIVEADVFDPLPVRNKRLNTRR